MGRTKHTVPAIQKPQSTVPAIVKPQPSALTTIKEGFSFGIGSAIAHRVVGSLFSQQKPVEKSVRDREYEQCLAEHSSCGDGASLCAYILTEAKEKDGQKK